jgi:hypothetical protein
MKDIIIEHLNELGKQLEKSYGSKLIILDKKDFDRFADDLVKKFNISGVGVTLPSLIEINFDGNLLTQISTTDKDLKVLRAMNGYGNAVDCKKVTIKEK